LSPSELVSRSLDKPAWTILGGCTTKYTLS
jgi:hypothetical protein